MLLKLRTQLYYNIAKMLEQVKNNTILSQIKLFKSEKLVVLTFR